MLREALDLGKHAMREISFIRTAMERAARFDAVPGIGLVGMGASAVVTWVLVPPDHPSWVLGWLADALVAFCVGLATMVVKARTAGLAIMSRPGKSFVFCFLPPLAVAGVLTFALIQADATHLLPGVWMCLYGLAALTGGVFSVRSVSVMGAVFLVAGVVCLTVLPWRLASLAMAATFGGAHVGFGVLIAWRHGG